MTDWSPLISLLVVFIFATVSYFVFLRSSLSLAPWVPTHKRDLARVAKLLKLQSGEHLLEAGCGDARVSIFLARKYPDVTVVGYELSVAMFVWGWWRAKLAGLPNLTICYGDVLKQELGVYDVVYIYGLTKTVNQKLLPKIKAELRPGGRLVSYAFAIKESESVAADVSETATNIYVYTRPI